jgi:hypothetical protein
MFFLPVLISDSLSLQKQEEDFLFCKPENPKFMRRMKDKSIAENQFDQHYSTSS